MKYYFGSIGIHFFSAVLLCTILGTIVWLLLTVLKKKTKGNIAWVYFWCKVNALCFTIPITYLLLLTKWQNGFLFSTGTFFYILAAALGFVWFIGMVIRLIRYYRIARQIKELTKSAFDCEASYKAVYKKVVKEGKFHRRVILQQSYAVQSPVVYGAFRPRILIPVMEYEEEPLSTVFWHELTHVKQGDTFWKALLNILRCVYWFHPAISRLQDIYAWECEYVCDLKVTKRFISAGEYFNIILQMVLKHKGKFNYHMVTLYESKDSLKERILVMKDYREGKRLKSGVLAALAVLLCVAGTATVFASSVGFQKGYTYLVEKTAEGEEETVDELQTDLEEFEGIEDGSGFTEDIIIEDNVNARGSNVSIDWDVPAGNRVRGSEWYKTAGQTISITASLNPKKTMEIGIVNRDNQKQYVKPSSAFTKTFTVKTSGYYRVYATNPNSVTVNVFGGYVK